MGVGLRLAKEFDLENRCVSLVFVPEIFNALALF